MLRLSSNSAFQAKNDMLVSRLKWHTAMICHKAGFHRSDVQSPLGEVGAWRFEGLTQAISDFRGVDFPWKKGSPRVSYPGILDGADSSSVGRPHVAGPGGPRCPPDGAGGSGVQRSLRRPRLRSRSDAVHGRTTSHGIALRIPPRACVNDGAANCAATCSATVRDQTLYRVKYNCAHQIFLSFVCSIGLLHTPRMIAIHSSSLLSLHHPLSPSPSISLCLVCPRFAVQRGSHST